MTKSNTTENDFLNYIFNAAAFSWNAISSTYVSLHTDDPGEGGNQASNETAYTNYARVAVVRTSSGWTVSGNTASNTALIQFPQCSTVGATLTHVAIGTTSSGAGQILYSGQLNSPLTVSNLIQPQFAIGALQIQED
jgi:hypothetical protein